VHYFILAFDLKDGFPLQKILRLRSAAQNGG